MSHGCGPCPQCAQHTAQQAHTACAAYRCVGQVEQKRLNIPADVPCAVQQWNGLIAVNYAARAAGGVALALCLHVVLLALQQG